MNLKITAEQAREIYVSKDTSTVLAERYGISSRYVRDIKQGHRWKREILNLGRTLAASERPKENGA